MPKPEESGRPRPSALNQSDLKSGISVLRNARHARSGTDRPTRLRMSPRVRQELAELVTKAGFDAKEFEAIPARNLVELRHRAEKQRSDATRDSAAITDALHRDALSRLDSLKRPLAPPGQFSVILDHPDVIQFDTDENAYLESMHYEPYNSFAKLMIDEDSDAFATENVSFYFTWQNTRPSTVQIAVLAALVAHGYAVAATYGGFITWYGVAFIGLTGTLTVLQQWLQPPTLAPLDPSAYEHVAVANVLEGWSFGDPGEVDVRQVAKGFPLEYETLTVPPKGVLVFEVNLSIGYETLNGGVIVDLANGAYEVQCPYIVLTGSDVSP